MNSLLLQRKMKASLERLATMKRSSMSIVGCTSNSGAFFSIFPLFNHVDNITSRRRVALDLSHPLLSALQLECNRKTCPEMKADEWLYLCVAHGNGVEVRCLLLG